MKKVQYSFTNLTLGGGQADCEVRSHVEPCQYYTLVINKVKVDRAGVCGVHRGCYRWARWCWFWRWGGIRSLKMYLIVVFTQVSHFIIRCLPCNSIQQNILRLRNELDSQGTGQEVRFCMTWVEKSLCERHTSEQAEERSYLVTMTWLDLHKRVTAKNKCKELKLKKLLEQHPQALGISQICKISYPLVLQYPK